MMRRLCAALLLGCIAALAQAQSVAILNAEFGIFDASNPKEIVFEPTLVVPHKEGQRLTIPHERRNQASQRQLVPVAGRIYGEWAIGPQEPPGKRRLQVLVEDRPPVVFEYEVR